MGLGLYVPEIPGPHRPCQSRVLCWASSFRRMAWEDSSADVEPGTSRNRFSGVAFRDNYQQAAGGVPAPQQGRSNVSFCSGRDIKRDPLSTTAILTVSNRKGISSDNRANLVEQT